MLASSVLDDASNVTASPRLGTVGAWVKPATGPTLTAMVWLV